MVFKLVGQERESIRAFNLIQKKLNFVLILKPIKIEQNYKKEKVLRHERIQYVRPSEN